MKAIVRTAFALPIIGVFTVGVCMATYVGVSSLSKSEAALQRGNVAQETKKSEIRKSPAALILSKLGLNPFRTRSYRVFAAVIENHESAREHQAGLNEALIVEEWMVEGFISRFVAIFNADRTGESIGPIRSLRPYFVDGTSMWVDHIVHAGGSPEAFVAAEKDDIKSMNALMGAYNPYFERKDGAAAPHDLFISEENLLKMLESETLPEMSWPPYETGPIHESEKADEITINFYNPVHNVSYAYDETRKKYVRKNGYQEDQAFPSNLLMIQMPVQSIGELGRLTIPVPDSAPAMLFRDGYVWEGRWLRNSNDQKIAFKDTEGEDIPMASGQLWITVVPDLARVRWDSSTEDADQL